MKQLLITAFLGMLCLLTSCSNKKVFDEAEALKEIYVLHNAQRKYHFEKDSVSFVNQLSEDYVEVKNGIVSRPKLEDKLSRYHSYFSQVEFLKWDDLQEPIIRFSEDGSLASAGLSNKPPMPPHTCLQKPGAAAPLVAASAHAQRAARPPSPRAAARCQPQRPLSL